MKKQQEIISCACGCGTLIKRYDERIDARTGTPYLSTERRFAHNHHTRIPGQEPQKRYKSIAQEWVSCACGCGEKIERYYFSDGYWHERKYVHNHNHRGVPKGENQKQAAREATLRRVESGEHLQSIEKRRTNSNWLASVGRAAALLNWNKRGRSNIREYPIEWNDELRDAIKQRDNYQCRTCNSESDLCVHHIDFNKANCSPDNLITLCRSCHGKEHSQKGYKFSRKHS